MNSIFTRRSIRKFVSKPVEEEKVELLLKAAMSAPSAGNQQPWEFIVITEKDILTEIPKFHPYSSMLNQAAGAVVVCAIPALEKFKGFMIQDCSAATQNILLMANELGLGAVWLGIHPIEERVEGMRKLLGIPVDVIPFSLIPYGYPDEDKEPQNRYNPNRVHRNWW